jgi:hypothetical protein
MHTSYQQAIELARRRRLALTLRMWRSGEEALARVGRPELRAGYERAIALALGSLPSDSCMALPSDSCMASLVRHYCERGGAVDDCVAAACRASDPQGQIVPGIVRNAAYWRRLQELVQAA